MFDSLKIFINKNINRSSSHRLIVILFICFIYRLFYFGFLRSGVFYYSSDSVTYFALINVFKGIINLYRTPLYSIIIEILEYFSEKNLIRNLFILHQIISFLTIIPFYLIVKNLLRNNGLIIGTTCFYGCWHLLLNQNININPESFCIAGSTWMLYLIFKYVQKPSKVTAVSAGIFSFFLVMLKPIYLISVLIVLLFLIMRFLLFRAEKIKIFCGIAGCLVTSAGIFGYCEINRQSNGDFALSKVSLNNYLSNIISSGAYRFGSDQELIDLIDSTKNKGIYNSISYLNNESIDNFKNCLKQFPKNLKPSEDIVNGSIFPDLKNYSSGRIYSFVTRAKFSRVYIKYMAKRIINTFWNFKELFLLMIIESAFIFNAFFLTKKLPWTILFCIMFITGQFATLEIAGGQFSLGGIEQIEDIDRLLIPSYPFIIILTSSFLETLISSINKREFIKLITT